jgi:hypothetical protein
MKKHQEKLLDAVLAGIIVVSGAAFAIQPSAKQAPRAQIETSALDSAVLFAGKAA